MMPKALSIFKNYPGVVSQSINIRLIFWSWRRSIESDTTEYYAIEHRAVGGAGHVTVCLLPLVPQLARLWQGKNQLFLHSSHHSTTHTSFHWHSPAPIAGIMCFINNGAESTPTLLWSAQTYVSFSVCESLCGNNTVILLLLKLLRLLLILLLIILIIDNLIP